MSSRCCRTPRRRRWCASRSSRSAPNTPRKSPHQEEVLRQERDTLQRQQAIAVAGGAQPEGPRVPGKGQRARPQRAGKRQALEKSNAEALEKIQEVMLKIITDIAKDRKANLVFQRSELVLFDQGFDVTDEVLQKLDEQLPTMTVNFVAPVAAMPRPAAAPTPAAPPSRQPRRRNRAGLRLGRGVRRWPTPAFSIAPGPFARRAGGAERGAAARRRRRRPPVRRCRAARDGRARRCDLSRQPQIYRRLRAARAPARRSSTSAIGGARAGGDGAADRRAIPTRRLRGRRRPSIRQPPVVPRRAPTRGHRSDGDGPGDCAIGANVVIEAGRAARRALPDRRQCGDRRRGRARRRLPDRRQRHAQPLPDRRARRAASRRAHRPGRVSASRRIAAGPVKVPQLGRVIIGDDVDIGANTTIDRGSGHDTVIGAGHDDR